MEVTITSFTKWIGIPKNAIGIGVEVIYNEASKIIKWVKISDVTILSIQTNLYLMRYIMATRKKWAEHSAAYYLILG